MRRLPTVVVVSMVLGGLGAATVWAQRGGVFRGSRDHPAISYSTGALDNAVVTLNRQIREGTVRLEFGDDAGYLRSVLDALDTPVESQVAVFSPTSNQANLIASDNPRVIYFQDDVSVAWVRGTDTLEVAAQDVQQGTVFYTLPQTPVGVPQFVRDDQCLACHLSWETLGVPGLQILSTFPLTSDPNAYATGFVSDHRAPVEDRWGGWYVTGEHAPMLHMGNVEVTDVDDPNASVGVARPSLPSLDDVFDVDGYLSAHSDIVALMVLEHQVHMSNLITRLGWEARRVLFREQGGGGDDGQPELVEDAAVELVDYMLFVDEAPLTTPFQGTSGFSGIFAERGPRDAKGRSLREFDLNRRLMRYPCSYMIYADAFSVLPELAKDAVYRRLWHILSGRDTEGPYARLARADREAVVEILRDTKPDLPAYFQGTVQ